MFLVGTLSKTDHSKSKTLFERQSRVKILAFLTIYEDFNCKIRGCYLCLQLLENGGSCKLQEGTNQFGEVVRHVDRWRQMPQISRR